jgi:hypothetical protein
VGAPRSVKIRRSDNFFCFFYLFIFRIIFCWQFFLLSPLPSCPLAPTLLLQVHSESAIRAAAWVRAASQSSSVFDRQTKEECFAQCSPTARHYGRILCSIVKKLNIYYTKSLVNATFGSGKIVAFTKFCVKQVKRYQFIQNQVKFVLVKEFLFHSGC